MTVHLDLEWKSSLPETKVFAFGDVRPVINSRANKITKLLDVFYGLGALSKDGPDRAGEGMVWRGSIGATPPFEQPEVIAGSVDQFSTPFFLGWIGAPVAEGYFSAEAGTLHELYQRVFDDVPSQHIPDAAPIVLLEVVGVASSSDIHDRALKKPVHEGNTLITDRPSEYFNFRIVQHDLEQRGHSAKQLLTLAVVGVGYRPGSAPSAFRQFEEAVFYEPPRTETAAESISYGAHEQGRVRTHSHMMAWRDEPRVHEHLAAVHSSSDKKDAARELEQELFPGLLARKPDYVLHLDEWSRIMSGLLRVYMCSPGNIQFLPV